MSSLRDALLPLLLLGAAGCSLAPGPAPAPGPGAGVEAAAAPETPAGPSTQLSTPMLTPQEWMDAVGDLDPWQDGTTAELTAPPPATDRTGLPDEILDSRVARDTVFRERIGYWLRAWQRAEGERLPIYLARMGVYQELVDRTLDAHGLPWSLRYLPFLESGYSPQAVSRASAVGLWQLMSPTATGLGISVSPLVDERRDPVRSTEAAARFLKELRARFGSWYLALAAYNGGPSRVRRLLEQHAPGAQPSDSLYLVLAPHLPRETREFVARFLAGARIAMDPEAFGITRPVDVSPLSWEEVVVPDAVTLDVLAGAVGTSRQALEALNPQLLRGMTPGGVATTVRVPPGTAAGFADRYASIPPAERVTLTLHVVASGETLTHIARRYGVGVDEIQQANPRVRPRRLRVGDELVVPRAPGAGGGAEDRDGETARSRAATSPARSRAPARNLRAAETHVVVPGDTLWDIARRYSVALEDLLRWNEMGHRQVLRLGQRLRVAPTS